MSRLKVWCVCLLAWIFGFAGSALAQSSYDALCEAAMLDTDRTAAWLEISHASFFQPVMIHPDDDSYYAYHDAYGNEAEGEALYIQPSYNARDFSDPVTIVYGSSSAEGTVFRNLQETYSGRFEECSSIRLHLPQGTSEYKVFAAIPYSAVHILHYYDFMDEQRFASFFDGVFSTRALGMHLVKDQKPEFGDKILILSTAVRGDKTQRYLVMGKLVTK